MNGQNYIYLLNPSFLNLGNEIKSEFLEILNDLKEKEYIDDILVIEDISNIKEENIEYLKEKNIKNINLNIRSTNQYILQKAEITITYSEMQEKVELLKKHKINVFLTFDIGMLYSTRLDNFNTAKDIAALKPFGVIIRPVLVYAETLLEEPYFKDEYIPRKH